MGLILFILFAIILLGAIVLLSVVKSVSSFFSGKQASSSGNTYNRSSSSWNREEHDSYSVKTHKKVFSKDEGEYVPYEEIKD